MASGICKNLDGKVAIYRQFQLIDDISPVVLNYFGAKKRVKEFLELVTNTASVALAASKMGLSVLEVYEVIDSDEQMIRLVNLSLQYAHEIAQSTLYDRAINGYMEEVFVDGKKVGEKKKFSVSCLIHYLKRMDNKKNTDANRNNDLGIGYNIEVPQYDKQKAT